MGKIEQAILSKGKHRNEVFPCSYGNVNNAIGVSGCRAVKIANRLLKEGKIKKFENSSQYSRIGNCLDGSWKYGMVFEGRVYLLD